jgi:hypothetical protein
MQEWNQTYTKMMFGTVEYCHDRIEFANWSFKLNAAFITCNLQMPNQSMLSVQLISLFVLGRVKFILKWFLICLDVLK